MNVIAFIEPQQEVVERTLHHCGLHDLSLPRAPPTGVGSVGDPDGCWDSEASSSDEPQELPYVDGGTFRATFGC